MSGFGPSQEVIYILLFVILVIIIAIIGVGYYLGGVKGAVLAALIPIGFYGYQNKKKNIWLIGF